MTDQLLPPDTPIDLDNCAREPIHLSGAVQPRGVLFVATDPDLVVQQVSANVGDLLGLSVEAITGRPLSAALGTAAHEAVSYAISAFGDLQARNPIEQLLVVRGQERLFDLILHRTEQGLLLVEAEVADGPRPLSFPNTYLAVRSSIEDLNAAVGLTELYDLTVDAVRSLTGFDRVMVYRYDRDWNGEVVAEARREDLEPFLGLHYPASDIPAQARALYERNWIRLISDVDYEPAPLRPSINPTVGAVDLTSSTLRSVSPIHLEYLQNMGVRASMSISLLQDGRLWGLIVCHHYAGPHTPPYGIRTAAEFLGSALSIRLHDREDAESVQARLDARSRLASIVGASRDSQVPLARALANAGLETLVPAGGVAVRADGITETSGTVPDPETVEQLLAWAGSSDGETVSRDRTSDIAGADPSIAAGALVCSLPDDGFVMWVRPETRTTVDWGGDPHTKARAVRTDGGEVRISPRQSFDRWTEAVRGRCDPWTDREVELALELRHHLVESMYARSRFDVALAESVQRSLLPAIPDVPGWSLSAHYQPAAGGRIGGDWYDAFALPDGRLALVLGDVAGHGVPAAGAMAQLRNVLRAYLHGGASPQRAVSLLNAYVVDMHPQLFATAFVAIVDPSTGAVTAASAGHPQPLLVVDRVHPVDVATSPPLGVPVDAVVESAFVVPAGAALLAFSDGLVERKDEDIQQGLRRLQEAVERGPLTASGLVTRIPTDGRDDVTVLVANRLR